MKNLYLTILSVLCLNSNAQWYSCGVTNGLNNRHIETINSFIVHQGRLFAHNGMTGLLYSDNQGNTWDTVNYSFNGSITYLYELDQKLYASTMINGVLGGYPYYSTDKGATWSIDTAGMLVSAVNANFPATVVKAQSLGDYYFYQFNIPQAYQWRHKDSSVYHRDAYANLNLLSGWHVDNDTLWGLLNGRFQYCTQVKAAFTQVNTNLPILASSHIQKQANQVFIAALDANLDWTLYRSNDYGKNWDTVQLQNLLGIGAFGLKRGINKLFVDGGEVWLGPQSKGQNTRSEIIYSNNRGDTWSIDSLNLPIDPFGTQAVRVFQKTNNYMFAAFNFKDVYRKGAGNMP